MKSIKFLHKFIEFYRFVRTVSVCYPLDDFVGGYQAIRYAPYSKIEPLLKKWFKAHNIDKCFKDGYY